MPQLAEPSWLVRVTYGVAIFVSGVPILAARWIGPYRHDDVYITLTFARNIAAGAGFVYNGGPSILGTTSPLLALMVAGVSKLLPGVSLLTIATGISVVAWIATAWLLAACWKKLGGNHFGVAALAILLLTQLGGAAILGMEVSLFQFLLATTIYLYLSERLDWAGLGLGLLFLTRGEGLLLGPILLLWDFVFKKRIPWRFVGATTAVLFVWSIYGLATFGSVLPSTLGAKIAQRESGLWRPFGERLFAEWLPEWFATTPASLIIIALMTCGLLYAIWVRREWLIFVCWGIVYVVSYAILSPAGYWWYTMPIFFVFNLFAALGVAALPHLILRLRGQGQRDGIWLAGALLLALLLAAANAQGLRNSLLAYSASLDPANESSNFVTYYPAMGEWFMQNTQPGETIAYVEVGYLGYSTRNRFIDLTGLLTPSISEHVKSRDLSWGFLNYKPDYVLIVPEFDWLMGGIRQLPEFKQSYRQVYQMTRAQREPLTIYARLDSNYLRMHGGD